MSDQQSAIADSTDVLEWRVIAIPTSSRTRRADTASGLQSPRTWPSRPPALRQSCSAGPPCSPRCPFARTDAPEAGAARTRAETSQTTSPSPARSCRSARGHRPRRSVAGRCSFRSSWDRRRAARSPAATAASRWGRRPFPPPPVDLPVRTVDGCDATPASARTATRETSRLDRPTPC